MDGEHISPVTGPALVVRAQAASWSLPAGPAYVIGRDPAADVVVADHRVSWRHAVLSFEGHGWVLADNGSTNGTYAGDRRADRVEINGACVVRLGDPAEGPILSCTVVSAGTGTGPALGRVLRIGRAADNDLVIADPSVSGHHAELRTAGGVSRIVDLGSRNGTFVNEQRVTAAALAEGDVATFGTSTFRLAGHELQEVTGPGPVTGNPAPPPPAAAAEPAAQTAIDMPAAPAGPPGEGPLEIPYGPLAGAAGRAVRELRHPERQRHAARLLPPVRAHLRGRGAGQDVAARRGLRSRPAGRGGGGRGAVRQAGRGDQLLRPARPLPRHRHLGDRRRRALRQGAPGDAAVVRAVAPADPARADEGPGAQAGRGVVGAARGRAAGRAHLDGAVHPGGVRPRRVRLRLRPARRESAGAAPVRRGGPGEHQGEHPAGGRAPARLHAPGRAGPPRPHQDVPAAQRRTVPDGRRAGPGPGAHRPARAADRPAQPAAEHAGPRDGPAARPRDRA